ncbi:carnitine acetyl transferase [Multifurca ochricompacta]|uniref:Carnitine acetyl transferase n=1 Tax=Multifurca ochricompacta TaxID=376703 RepID=A0AAD4QRJ0_9AGAM|nr:carnitine acetyl transferase [Multifurca ochricompacta]
MLLYCHRIRPTHLLPTSTFTCYRYSTMPDHPPSRRPPAWKSAAPFPPVSTTTFAAQSTLPKLPVLPLTPTIDRLKRSLIPIAHSRTELEEAFRKIDTFASTVGPELQRRLEAHAKDKPHWLEEWWDDGAYLSYRDSVYGFADPPSAQGLLGPSTARHRAASLTRAAMLYRRALKRGEVPAEGTQDTPLCMDTYRWLFDCARVPGTKGLDWSVSHAKEGDTSGDGHVVVLRNGHFWRLDAAQGGRILSTTELEAQIEHIVSASTTKLPAVGALTAANRDLWASDYVHLRSLSPSNTVLLDTIHSAAYVLCLDPATPSDFTTTSRFLWHGAPDGLRDRWVDKPVQMIVFDSARAGLMGEHSVMDGTPTLAFTDAICTALADPAFDHGSPAISSVPAPVELNWTLDAALEQSIARAEKDAAALIATQAMSVIKTGYGKRAVKAARVSPDAWAQLLIQLAYARLLHARGEKRQGGTYESATTRKFFKGRTEVVRVVTSESDAFVRAMMGGDEVDASVENKRALFEKAAKVHVSNAQTAGRGEGVDRHLLGLRKVLKEGEDLPEMFDDSVVKRASHWTLSTSALFSKHLREYGWGEVRRTNGFGIAYITGFDDYLQFTITSRTEMPNEELAAEISRAAEDLHTLYFPGEAPKCRL